MEFLHFGLLPYFLPLAAIPIVLHLLTLQRLKTVELATFRFLFDSYLQQRRKMKFLEALLAFLRTMFLLLLVLALARPVVQHWKSFFAGSAAGRDVVLVLDCSASMGAVTDGLSGLDRAKQAALTLVSRLDESDRVTIVRMTSRAEEVSSRFASDEAGIRAAVEDLKVTASRGNAFAVFASLFGPESRPLIRPRVHVFSDLQSGGWAEFAAAESQTLIPVACEVVLVQVGSQHELPNRAVIGEAPTPARAIVGLPVSLRPRVINLSQSEAQDVVVSTFLDEQEVGRATLHLEPGETGEAELIFTPTTAGLLRGRFEIPPDRFTPDDSFLFALQAVPQLKVVLVNGNPASEPLENEALYLRTAMVAAETESSPPLPESPARTDGEQKLLRALNVVEVAESELKAETLLDADVVILANCGGLRAPDQFQWLLQFVAGGGGLVILPGDRVNPDQYNQQWLNTVPPYSEPLLAAKLGPPIGELQQAKTFSRLGGIDYAHPVFSPFASDQSKYLTKLTIYRRFSLELPAERPNGWPVAQLAEGGPALLEGRFGAGRVLFSAFPFHTRWTNLPLRPEFVPLVLRMVAYASRPAGVQGPAAVPADTPVEFVLDPTWAPASAKLTDALGRVTPLSFQRSNAQLVAAYERAADKGYYTLEAQGGRAEQPRVGQVGFAVNVSPDESRFTTLGKDELAELLPDVRWSLIDASAEAQQLHGGVGSEHEIWRPLVYLTLMIIGAEFLLATLGGASAGAPPRSLSQRWTDFVHGGWVGRATGGAREAGADADANAAETTRRSAS